MVDEGNAQQPPALHLQSPLPAEVHMRVRKLAYEQQLMIQAASAAEYRKLLEAVRYARRSIASRIIRVTPRPKELTIYVQRYGRKNGER